MEDQQTTIDYPKIQPSVQYFDPRLLPPPPPPAPIAAYYYYPNHQYKPQQATLEEEETATLENDTENKRDMNEAFYYSSSNYMNWSLPYYSAQNFTDNAVPLTQPINYQPTAPAKPNPYSTTDSKLTNNELEEITKTVDEQITEHSDFALSLIIFLLGFFLFVPWFFGFLYLRSKSIAARKLAVTSLVLAVLSMIAMVLFFTVFEDVSIEIEPK
ncbi:hypothetical protein PPL_02347 [Heterostelium album PN500]|uniref:Uncharacterized protein n=1 Tax=Heterostelium pallidum (strain ATCC 26659 / Pp 5 / PN500) TaxID=670386 RepID=D3B220_HETP5|nr:hypothetical protein PPL_02347 [Heterostelium album PN500]EFA85344.1 hypothetical protein PPL_02347 [Heterostelium album PN500]|eukprot:XP_020437453.1 hypothetical protein PPL_02347 [Heterostelium album PN500]